MLRFSCCILAVLSLTTTVRGETTVDDLRAQVEDLRRQLAKRDESARSPSSSLDTALGSKYGPNAPVTTKTGKLQIGAFMSIWSRTSEKHGSDVFQGTGRPGSTSQPVDNGGYQLRRTELRLTMDIHENIRAYVSIDPAREATSFAPFPSNQGLFKSNVEVPSAENDDIPVANNSLGRVLTGAGATNTMLQDAYISYHGVIPHHDFTIGQFRPAMGEEGPRESGYLDFADRAMVTQTNDFRDLGADVHGTWWDDKIQYHASVFDGAGNLFLTRGQFQNRSDDNSDKDVLGSLFVRPIWKDECWGSLELGGSGEMGRHGKRTFGLNTTNAYREALWGYYKPMGPVHGMWIRGEWGKQHDRTTPNTVDALNLGSGPHNEQAFPSPFSREGWYAATGYKLSDSVFSERLEGGGFFNNLLQPVEFVFRYEQFQNIITEDLGQPDFKTKLFKTQVYTAGVNYYVAGYKYRVQANFDVVREDHNTARGIINVRNNQFVFTYQILF